MPKEGDATTGLVVLMLFKRSVTGKTGGKYSFAHSESDRKCNYKQDNTTVSVCICSVEERTVWRICLGVHSCLRAARLQGEMRAACSDGNCELYPTVGDRLWEEERITAG